MIWVKDLDEIRVWRNVPSLLVSDNETVDADADGRACCDLNGCYGRIGESSGSSQKGEAFHIREPFAFVVLWTVQHWTVAVGLATLVARGEEEPGPSRWYRVWHVVNRRGWALLVVLMILSAALLPFMEVEALGEDAGASDVTGQIEVLTLGDEGAAYAEGLAGSATQPSENGSYYADRFLGQFAVWLRTSWLVPILVALGLATAFVHYALDRAVYRFSDPEVRRAAKGLLDPPP